MSTDTETPTTASEQNVAITSQETTITTPVVQETVTASTEVLTVPTANVKVRKEKRIDYLDEDPVLKYELTDEMISSKVFRQVYFVACFVSPENVSNCKTRASKVRGVYATIEAANAAAKAFTEMDGGLFNNFVGEVGKWCEFDPDTKQVPDQVHTDERLNTLMKGYRDNYEKSKKVHEDRVAEVQRRNKQAPKMNEILDRMHGKLDKIKEKKEKTANTEKLVPAADQTNSETNAGADTPVTEEAATAMTAAARRRLKERARKATTESIAREEQELADRARKLALMREEMARRGAKTQQLSQDVEDIRAAFEQKRAEISAQ
jgi:hypothetical protein